MNELAPSFQPIRPRNTSESLNRKYRKIALAMRTVRYAGFKGLKEVQQRAGITKEVVRNTQPFAKLDVEAPAKKLLIAGHSIAYGVGTTNPQDSIAGRFAKAVPNATLENFSFPGWRACDFNNQFVPAVQSPEFDHTVICIGANDIAYFSSIRSFRHNLGEVLKRSTDMSQSVVLMGNPLLGNTPFLSGSERLSALYNNRTNQVFEAACDVIAQSSTPVGHADPLAMNAAINSEPESYCEDGYHPGPTLCKHWFENGIAPAFKAVNHPLSA